MDSSSLVSELSLYQLAQQFYSGQELLISPDSLKSHLSLIIDLLIEQQLPAKVWLKLPHTKSWLTEIEKYLQQGNIEQVYWFSYHNNHPASLLTQVELATTIVPIKISNKSWLKKESFFIVLSPQFSSLLLAQWQKAKLEVEADGKRFQQPYLKVIFDLDTTGIQSIISEINQIFPPTSLEESNLRQEPKLKNNLTSEPKLITELLGKQITYIDTLQTSLNSLASSQSKVNNFSQFLDIQADFINNLVRELRSPITRMKTALSLLESKQIKGEQRQRYLQMIDDECDRQNSLISGLLELLQLDVQLEFEPVKLEDLVPGIVSTYQPLAQEKEVQLGYTIPSNLPPVSCPISWLRQIIIQLLNNSLQCTPAQGRVFVQAALNNDWVELIVSDTGVGIDSQELNKIFESFYRVRTAEKGKAASAGLGLTIVQQLVQRCGGSITVSSKTGKGSVFKVLLPALPEELIED